VGIVLARCFTLELKFFEFFKLFKQFELSELFKKFKQFELYIQLRQFRPLSEHSVNLTTKCQLSEYYENLCYKV